MTRIKTANSQDLVGKTIVRMEFYKETNRESGSSRDYEMLLFSCSDGTLYRLGRKVPDESYAVNARITGDIFNLLGSPIVAAHECCNFGPLEYGGDAEYGEYMECFYTIETALGRVQLFWYIETEGFSAGSITSEEFIPE